MNEGELIGETVNDQSMTQTKHGRWAITWSPSDRDLIDALEDPNFVNNVVRMEKEIQRPMMTTVHPIYVGEEKKDRETIQRKMPEKACVGSPNQNTNKTSRITHNNQNTLDCSRSLIVVKPYAHLTTYVT